MAKSKSTSNPDEKMYFDRSLSELLEKQRLFTESIFARLPVGIEIYDPQGFLRNINDHALRMYGVDDRSKVVDKVNLFDSPYMDDVLLAKIRAGEDVVLEFEYHIDDASIKAVADLFRREGSDAWYKYSAEEILPKGTTCKYCGGTEFTKETDIMDVWFDSGVTHASVLMDRLGKWPCDLYLEGADQFRGWFQSSLLTAVAWKGQAPYKAVCSCGWVVDGQGRKMSKSLGNGILAQEVVDEYGADILRLWVASSDYHADIRISKEILKQLSEVYRKIRNTARYILGNLFDFNPDTDSVAYEDLMEVDRWALAKMNDLVKVAREAYDSFEFHDIYHGVYNFCIVDMSNFYLDIIKDRLYCEEKDGAKRRSAQTALFLILDTMTKLMAPILCFTCDEIWLSMPHRSGDDGRNVVFNDMNKPFTDYALDETAMEKWSAVEKLRDDVNAVLEAARAEKKIGKALEAHVALHAGDDAASAALVQVMGLNLAELFIVSDCQVSSAEPDAASTVGQGANFPGLTVEVSEARGDKCERCWMHSPTVGADADHPTLCARCAAVVRKLPQF